MRFKLISLVAFASGVAILAGIWWLAVGSPMSAAKGALRDSLNDPDSASFREFKASSKDSMVFCGEVNAKNRMGGFAGFTRFVVKLSNHEVLLAPDSAQVDAELVRYADEVRRGLLPGSAPNLEMATRFEPAWSEFCGTAVVQD